MESLDTTILNTAVPAISAALHVGPLSMKAVLASYTLSLAVFIPISGWVADRFGTRRVFATAIGLFYSGVFFMRGIERHRFTHRLPHPARLRRVHDGARGPAHARASLRKIRSSPHNEFRFNTGPDGSHAWADRRWSDRRLPSLAGDSTSRSA